MFYGIQPESVDACEIKVPLEPFPGFVSDNGIPHIHVHPHQVIEVAFLRIKTLLDVPGRCIDREFSCGIRLDAQFVKFLQRCAAAKFLFVEVCYFHEFKKFFQFYDFNPQS